MYMMDETAERRLLRVSGRAHAESERPIPARVQAYLKGEPPIGTGTAAAPSGSEERRRFNRQPIESEVLVRRIGGFNFQVALKDISSAGCRVEMLEACELDDSVIARFPHLEPLGSRVCWTKGTTTGLQFQMSVHPAVLDMLLNRLKGGALSPA